MKLNTEALALFLMLTPLAKADTIVINFSGTITYSDGPAPSLEKIVVGEAYSGQAVYTLPPSESDSPGQYVFTSASDGLTVFIGGSTVSSVGFGQNIGSVSQPLFPFPNYGYYDSFVYRGAVANGNLPGVTPVSSYNLSLDLFGNLGLIACCEMPSAIDSAYLLQASTLNPPPFDGGTGTGMSINFSEENAGAHVFGDITSLQLTDISTPEPGTISLSAFALIGVGFAVRRRVKNSL